MVEERFSVSRGGYENFQRELQDMESRREQQLAALTEFDYTDLDTGREEAAYDETRETKEDIEQRIGHLKLGLENAEVIDEDPDPERINPGDRAVVWDFNERRLLTFELRCSEELSDGH